MATTVATAKDCMLHTEVMLEECFTQGLVDAAGTKGTFSTGALRAILDNQSRSQISITKIDKAEPGNPDCDKITAYFKGRVPDCGEIDDTCHDFNCEDGDAKDTTYFHDSIAIDQCASVKFEIPETLFRCRPENLNVEFMKIFKDEVRKLVAKKNKQIITSLAAGVGACYGSTDLTSVAPKKLAIFCPDPTTGKVVPQPMGFHSVLNEYNWQTHGMTTEAPVFVSGSSLFGAYAFSQGIFQGNTDGADSNAFDVQAYQDNMMAACLKGGPAQEPIISFLPSAIKHIPYRKFAPQNVNTTSQAGGRVAWSPIRVTKERVKQVIDIGALVGLRDENGNIINYPVDAQFYWKECDEKLIITLVDKYALCKIPQRQFCDGALHNFCLLWDAVCEPYTCADMSDCNRFPA